LSVLFTVKTVGRLMENESTILVPDERYGAPEVICDEVLSPKKSSSKSRVVSRSMGLQRALRLGVRYVTVEEGAIAGASPDPAAYDLGAGLELRWLIKG
jgi:hypothetical protein